MKPHAFFWATVFALSFLHCTYAEEPGSGRFPDYKFVTSTPNVQDMWPCFSPDSQRLLFTRTTDGKSWALFAVSVDEGKPSPFPAQSPMIGTRANWLAAQDLIAYNGQPSKGRFNLVVMKGDGTGMRVLETATISDQMSYPSWYPDGKSFAIVDFNGDEGSAIKRIDIENGTVVTLTDPKTHWAGVPRVSPDGKTIVMCGQVKQGQRYSQYQNQIWFLNRDGDLRPLDSKRGWAPFWSPDGKWIVFASDRGGEDGRRAIFVASPDGKIVQQLTPPELNAGHPTWSPDGKLIAFFAQLSADKESRGLAVVQADEALKLIATRIETRSPALAQAPVKPATGPLRVQMDLAAMAPRNDLASTQYCLANPGKEYLVYLPEGSEVTVGVSAAKGAMEVEWFNPRTAEKRAGDIVDGGAERLFQTPFKGEAVLYLQAKSRTSSESGN